MTENIIIAIIGIIGSVGGAWLVNSWKTKALEEKVTELYQKILDLQAENKRLKEGWGRCQEANKRLQARVRQLERRMDTGPLKGKE